MWKADTNTSIMLDFDEYYKQAGLNLEEAEKDDYKAIAEAIQKGWEYTASDLNDAFVILCANLGETSEEDRAYYFWQMSNFSNHQIDPIANKRIFTLFDEAVEVYCELYMQAGIIKESVDL